MRTVSYRKRSEPQSPEEAFSRAKKRALYLLGERQYCRGELLCKLTKTYGEDIAESAVEYVCERGYINDEDYAPRFAEYLIRRKHWGKRRVRQEMLHRGLDRELVENTLSEISNEQLDEQLKSLIERKYGDKIRERDDRRRTAAALARRGFEFSAIMRCIDEIVQYDEDVFDESEEFWEDEEF